MFKNYEQNIDGVYKLQTSQMKLKEMRHQTKLLDRSWGKH